MADTYIRNEKCNLLARVRRAGLPFRDQDNILVGVDYTTFDSGGMSNVRFTREGATALRDALHIFLTRNRREVTIARGPDNKLRMEEK